MSQIHVYEFIRYVLALLCGLAAWRLRAWYFAVSAIALAIPQSLYDPNYWRELWLPIEAIRLILATGFTVWIIRSSSRKALLRGERDTVFLFGASVGLFLVSASWLWIPQNAFQSALTLRQYVYLVLTAISVCWWLWTRHIRPALIPIESDQLALLWALWLAFTTISASAGKGGLFWQVTPWVQGAKTWAVVGMVDVFAKCLIAALLITFQPRKPASQ